MVPPSVCCQEAFAHAGLTCNHDTIICLGTGFGLMKHQCHAFVLRHNGLEGVRVFYIGKRLRFFKQRHTAFELIAIQGIAHRQRGALYLQWLDQIIIGAQSYRLDGSGHVIHGRENNALGFRRNLLDLFKDIHAVMMGHDQIEHCQVEFMLFDQFQHFA